MIGIHKKAHSGLFETMKLLVFWGRSRHKVPSGRALKFLFAAVCVLAAANSKAFFWDADVKVLCGESILHEFRLTDGQIYLTLSVIEEGKKPRPFSREKLDDCKIKDIQNWSCGGKVTNDFFGKSAFSAAHMVINGKYHYLPSTFHPRTGFCTNYRQLN